MEVLPLPEAPMSRTWNEQVTTVRLSDPETCLTFFLMAMAQASNFFKSC